MIKHKIIFSILFFVAVSAKAQERQNPVVSPFGGIYDIPEATIKADPELEYKVVIDLVTGNEDAKEFNWSLNNVARMLNLHAISGADMSRMKVVVAVHGEATYSIANDKRYKAKYGVENPNKELIKALTNAGVTIAVCGQSLKGRGVATDEVLEEVAIATSMLTTVTTYQLKGYALLKF
ncbi:DsrE family protein [Fulvivirga sp.]|jgi:intracellular sulfur oxidation DsrE/DsrF family protein|uniref:DsrE family protein n=1 Tax=Fulvivirga sp. TaxID=1931237 RepID=UPI0032EC12ED